MPGQPKTRQPAPESRAEEHLRAENAALRAELERLGARFENPVELQVRQKEPAAPEPEEFALVGAGERKPGHKGPSDEALESVGARLCRILEERKPDTKWRYYRDEVLVPEGMTFFYAQDALRKMWGNSPGNPDPPAPRAYRRLTKTERDQRDAVFQHALDHIDEALDRSEGLHAEGHAVAAVGVLKYVDLLLARFRLALAQWQVGNSDWQGVLNDTQRDAEFERWLTEQLPDA